MFSAVYWDFSRYHPWIWLWKLINLSDRVIPHNGMTPTDLSLSKPSTVEGSAASINQPKTNYVFEIFSWACGDGQEGFTRSTLSIHSSSTKLFLHGINSIFISTFSYQTSYIRWFSGTCSAANSRLMMLLALWSMPSSIRISSISHLQ